MEAFPVKLEKYVNLAKDLNMVHANLITPQKISLISEPY